MTKPLSTSSLDTPMEANSFQNGWKKPEVTPLGMYYPLGPFQVRFPIRRLQQVLDTLQDSFRKLSVQVTYQDSPIMAKCCSLDQVEFTVCIFGCNTNPDEIIVEVERRCGDAISYHAYSHQLARDLRGSTETNLGGRPVAPCFWNKALLHQADSIAKFGSDDEAIADALETTCGLITNRRFDAQRLGLLSLLHMTDPNKSSLSVSTTVSKSLLFPNDPVQERISHMVFGYSFNDDSTADTAQSYDSDLAYLGLAVLSQALHVASQCKSLDMRSFLDNFSNDVVACILEKMHHVHSQPHMCYYAIQSLVALCECVPSLRSRINNRDVEEAQLVGDSCHLALAKASQKLLHALQA